MLNCVNLDVELSKLECWILQTTKLNCETNNVKSTIGVEKLETWNVQLQMWVQIVKLQHQMLKVQAKFKR